MNNLNPTILSLMVIGILIIPVLGMDYVEDNKREMVLQLGDENFQYKPIETAYVNETNIRTHFDYPSNNFIGNSTNCDMLAIKEYTGNHYDIEFTQNEITYIGNDTYSIDTTGLTYTDKIMVCLNLTSHNSTDYDIIKTKSTVSGLFEMFTHEDDDTTYYYYALVTSTDEITYVIELSDKILVPLFFDDYCYFTIDNPTLNPTIEFKITVAEMVNQTTLSLDDESSYYIILTSSIILSVFTLIFITDSIDILFDVKEKKNKWRK